MFPADRDRNEAAVRRVLAAGPGTLIQRRHVRGVLREVFVTTDGHVIKRYTHAGAPPRFRRPWILEYRALDRLRGEGAPRVVGYVTNNTGTGFQANLVRKFLPGEPVGEIDSALADDIAILMAGFHAAGVTTDDAHRHNFIRLPGRRLAFLDFGRARTFCRWNPLLLAGIAVDLHRFFRAGLQRDRSVWAAFLDAYFRHCSFGPAVRRLIRALIALDMRRFRWVRGGGTGRR